MNILFIGGDKWYLTIIGSKAVGLMEGMFSRTQSIISDALSPTKPSISVQANVICEW